MFGKRKIAALVAEFLGTGILTLLVLSVQRSTIGVPFFVAAIAGITLIAMVLAFGDISGAYLNPAITLALWTARRVSTLRAVVLIVAEFLGAWAAYYTYTYFVNSKLADVGGHFSGHTLAAEAVATGILGLVWAGASFNKWPKTVVAPAIGLAVMLAMVAASTAGLGLANPALALGTRAWVWGTYVLGPVIGAVVGVNLYGLLFAGDNGISFNLATAKAQVSKPASTAKKPAAKKSTKKKSSK
ncbi:MAG: aquaporin [Candidatus Saccharibacteria bacterium]